LRLLKKSFSSFSPLLGSHSKINNPYNKFLEEAEGSGWQIDRKLFQFFFAKNIKLIKINFRNIFAFGLYSAFFQYFYPCSREFRSALTLLFAFWLGFCSCLLQKYFNKLCSHKIKPKIAYNNGGEVSSW